MKDKIIVITGASEGLGKIVATKLAASDAKVVLIAHNQDKLNEVTQTIGENARAYLCDVSATSSVCIIHGWPCGSGRLAFSYKLLSKPPG